LGRDPDRSFQAALQGNLFQALEILGQDHILIKVEMLIIYEYLYEVFSWNVEALFVTFINPPALIVRHEI